MQSREVIMKRIEKLKEQLNKMPKEAVMKPTGRWNVVVETEDGVIRTFHMPDKRSAVLKKNDFYQVLVTKLKQKVSIRAVKEYKRIG